MTTEVPVFDVELSPLARQARVAYLHDVHLDASQRLAVGDRVRLRDEGGVVWDAVGVAREAARLGHSYRLTFAPPAPVD